MKKETGRRVRLITGDRTRIVSGAELTPIQSSITCNGGLPRPKSAGDLPAPDDGSGGGGGW